MSESVLDRIVGCLHGALVYNANAQEAPVALLWPDEGAQWLAVIDRIGERVPLVSLGRYDLATRRGPAYWIRCVVAGTLDAGLPEGVPVVYLPGVSRNALRAADSCPAELAPIAELQYRSQWPSHPNNRDWSIRALLSHAERGLGLHVSDDAETNAALLLALDHLLDERVDRLAKQVLDADYCNQLVNPDPPSMLLGGLTIPLVTGAGSATRSGRRSCSSVGSTTASIPRSMVRLPPPESWAAARSWAHVWTRLAEMPERYPGITEQLRKARPEELIVENIESGRRTTKWPKTSSATALETLKRSPPKVRGRKWSRSIPSTPGVAAPCGPNSIVRRSRSPSSGSLCQRA